LQCNLSLVRMEVCSCCPETCAVNETVK
jgi:hypothetical protein